MEEAGRGAIDAGPADVGPGQCVLREVGGRPLILARDAGGRLFALEGRCSHALLPLAGARLRGEALMCPHHGARFSLATGRPLGPPASAPLATYPVREAGGRLLVCLA